MATKKLSIMTTKRIAVLSLMVALIIVFSFVPISFGPITLALMIVPVLLIAQVDDFWSTAILGLFLGVINYIAWFTTKAASPLAPVFQNPLVCILPRLLIGVVSYWVGVGLRAVVKKVNKPLKKPQISAINNVIAGIATAMGVVTNTLFVGIFTLIFFNNKTMGSGASSFVIDIEYILAWFGLNFTIEVVAFSILIPSISYALKKANLTYQKLYFVTPVAQETIAVISSADNQPE